MLNNGRITVKPETLNLIVNITSSLKSCTRVGSRAIIDPSELENSDHDFMAPWSFENEAALELLGIKAVESKMYLDDHTISIFDNGETGCDSVQVTLKNPDSYPALLAMWKFLKDNPNVFRNVFWKRNVDKEQVKANINYFMKTYVVHMV